MKQSKTIIHYAPIIILLILLVYVGKAQIIPFEPFPKNNQTPSNIHTRTIFQKPNYSCGCLALPLNQENRVPFELPLQKIVYDVQITNGVADVSLIQTYINQGNKYLELQYRFPISPNSCIHKFVAIFSNLRMEGVVKEKEIAKIEYQQAVKLGKKAALGDVDSQSRDIFTLQIGNIAPGESVRIQISYTEELSISLNTFYQFNFVTKHNPRYVNSIPPKDYLSSFRNSVKTIGGKFEWDFKMRIKTSRKIVAYRSFSHQLLLESANEQKTELFFTLKSGQVFTKAFSFIYTTQNFELPSYSIGSTDSSTSVMVSFIPKFGSYDIKGAEQAATKGKRLEIDIQGVKGEYVFILDRSGSMNGQPMQKAKQALILFLKSLPTNTYFQVVSFGSTSQQMFSISQKSNMQTISSAKRQIQLMGADLGGTQIYQPLEKVLKSRAIDGYPKEIFLLTDGSVSNTEKVIDLVSKNIRNSRVHAIGVGNGVSQALIKGCAEKGKGQYIFIGNGEDPSAKIIQLLSDSFSPVITEVSLSYDRQLVDSIVKNPENSPYILKGEVVNFFIFFRGKLTKPTSISLSYVDSQNNIPYKSQITVYPQSKSEAFVDKLANYQRIKALEQAQADQGQLDSYLYCRDPVDKRKPIKMLITQLSIQHQIISKHTAFISVQKQLVNGRFQEISRKKREKVQIVQINGQTASSPLLQQEAFMLSPASSIQRTSPPPSIPSLMPAAIPFSTALPASSSASAFSFTSTKSGAASSASSLPNPTTFKSAKMAMPINPTDSSLPPLKKTIKDIVDQQLFQGFWQNESIIQELYGSNTLNSVKSLNDKSAVITYLIVIWIEKYHPEQQYSLIVKKARNWLKKQPRLSEFPKLYDSYLK